MNCDEANDLIQLYMDNELDAQTTLRVRDHLDLCHGCSGLLDAYVRQDSLLREEAGREPVTSDRLRKSVIDTLERESARPGKQWRSLLRAAAVVVVLGSVLVYLLMPDILTPGATVCALAASDHAGHCSLDARWKGITDEQELAVLARSYGLAAGVPDLSNFGFKQPCGRLCRLRDSNYLHIVYYATGQESLSLFARGSASAAGDLDLILREQLGYRVVIATGSSREMLIVTSRDEKAATDIARTVWTRVATAKNKSRVAANDSGRGFHPTVASNPIFGGVALASLELNRR
ncbi:MAG TPA: zf-HC2 domain-containing protein [Blastocatellia bacterium]|nr:zf-HC2 domain-containing protein [Blastocatellia bacterium]